jgi:hypothetical protein
MGWGGLGEQQREGGSREEAWGKKTEGVLRLAACSSRAARQKVRRLPALMIPCTTIMLITCAMVMVNCYAML